MCSPCDWALTFLHDEAGEMHMSWPFQPKLHCGFSTAAPENTAAGQVSVVEII